jgi:hypothetical protein
MNMQHALYNDRYTKRQRSSRDAAGKSRECPRQETLAKPTDVDIPMGAILAYLLGLGVVGVTTISGHFPWFLSTAALMLTMTLFFPLEANRDGK